MIPGTNIRISKEIILIIIATLLIWWGNSTITPFMPLLAQHLHFTLLQTSLFLSMMGIVRFVAQPFLGKLLSDHNEKRAIQLAFIFLVISSIGYIVFSNVYILTISRAIEALAFAMFAISVRVIINKDFEFRTISKINTYYSASQNLGRFIGPAIAGIAMSLAGIKSVFFITLALYFLGNVVALILNKFHNPKPSYQPPISHEIPGANLKFTLIIFLLLYLLEFIGLGLWLSGWSVYTVHVLKWNASLIGMSFSVLAISSIAVIPLYNRFSAAYLQRKIMLGILFLALQPICILIFKNVPSIIWIALVVGGAGATLYFSTFHTYIAKCLKGKQVAIFYGFVGSFSFAGQAIGQALAPILSHIFSYATPILFDFICLLIDLVAYWIFFLTLDPLKKKAVV